MGNQHFANSIPPMNYATSPMMPYSPAVPSPHYPPHFMGQYPFAHSITPAIPQHWGWSPVPVPYMQPQPQMQEQTTSSLEYASTVTSPQPEQNSSEQSIELLPPSASKKRGYDGEDTTSTRSEQDASQTSQDTHDEENQGTHSVEEQQPAEPISAPAPKRPPFPFAVPRALSRPSRSSAHERASSSLNPFASEFVFRAPPSAPTLNSAAKEFSPVHLQESSRSLFNVYAPEFNPSKSTSSIFGNTTFPTPKESLFPKPTAQDSSTFIKPSPTKKIIPIVKPEYTDDSSEMTESDTPRPRKQSRGLTSKDQVNDPQTPSDESPYFSPQDKEFNGYPSFWEQRLQESERKAQRDRPLTPAGPLARNLANELLDDQTENDESEDADTEEEEEISDKENVDVLDPEYVSEDTDDSIPGTTRGKMGTMRLLARHHSAAQLEKIVKERLQPVLKGLEALQLSVQRLSSKDREHRKKEEASDADDENEETTKKTGVLGLDRIRSAVVEALRQEKELFVGYGDKGVGETELRNLKSVIDSLKSKLLDAEDNLDREERRRSDTERRAELISRDLVHSERELDVKTEALQKAESEVTDLQKRHDQAKRGWDDERHAHNKLDDVIKGIRGSLGQMTDKNSKLAHEVSTLQSLTTTQKDDISNLREEISKARGENGKLSRERTRLEREIEDERARFANLQNELAETGKAVAEQETRWRDELRAENLRVQSLERSLADEERRVKKMEEECDKLGKIAEERGKLKAMVEASVSRERHLEGVKEALEKRAYTAEAQVKVAHEERVRFEREWSARSHKEREVFAQEISSLRATINTLQEEKAKVNILYERERGQLAVQAQKIESIGQEINQAAQNAIQREKLFESTTRDLKDSHSQIANLRQEIATLRDKLDKKDVQADSLRELADTARADIVKKDKQIADLEFIIASTTSPTSPTKKSRDDETFLKLQRREKEILRLREMMSALIQDNEELIAQSNEPIASEQQKKYNAMKNVLRAENLRRKALEKELARALTKVPSSQENVGRALASKSMVSLFDTPSSVVGGLDTPVSMRGFGGGEDTPLKGKGVLAVE
jgi:hypothetical protein